MKTKAQIAKDMYDCSLSSLSAGEKAAVTRKYNAQDDDEHCDTEDGYAEVKFGRPGVNGLKPVIVEEGTTIGNALLQSGLAINKAKEGVMERGGASVGLDDKVSDGTTYIIVPGVDSSEW